MVIAAVLIEAWSSHPVLSLAGHLTRPRIHLEVTVNLLFCDVYSLDVSVSDVLFCLAAPPLAGLLTCEVNVMEFTSRLCAQKKEK